MKVIIAGSRNLRINNLDIAMALTRLSNLMGLPSCSPRREIISGLEIVSGGASGVDECGESYSTQILDRPATVFRAEWKKYGKAAGPLRNDEMARYADAALLFFDGEPTPGTANMLAWMAILKKPYHVVVL